MLVEILEDTNGHEPVKVFPPGENFLDLRENPLGIERIADARRYLPLRSFLIAINGPESLFTSASACTEGDSSAAISTGDTHEFASQTTLVFAESALNSERDYYVELAASLKELLERDAGDTIRTVLRILRCEFTHQNIHGFCLEIHSTGSGKSPEQAQMRWGLGLARIQQALLFSGRALRQNLGE